ncbi:MAG: zinc ABC transporter substrate-binding protein, partial [Solirubrobacterales bacterium]|nr:zinc ABC transporter substrate-binding protein [Solirubrobacterales bacterium]
HAYGPTVADAVGLARSDMAIVNGIGYDRWSSQLLAADAPRPPIVLDVGDLLGLREGANPHQWYSPASVERVITAIAADYERLDPRDAAYFERRRIEIEQRGLAGYRRMLALIRGRYHGVAVGYSESIFEPLGRALGLRLLTPARFARAIAEGTEVSAGDTRTVEAQARNHEIDVWVYNRQNTTPDVERANQAARAAHIPIVAITETLAPASASFQQWQVSELTGLLRALEEATGR